MIKIHFLGCICRQNCTSSSSYQNPVKYGNYPDPGVLALADGSGFVAVSTSNYEKNSQTGPAFPILWSVDLVHWTMVGL
jgi:beta-xylosidase